MRALSIRQPWAWLIVQRHKPVENRDWETLYRGPLLIHAGQTLTRKYYTEMAELMAEEFGLALPEMADLPLGGIVGVCRVTGCVREHDSPYFTGPFGHVLADAAPLPFLPMKGKLSYFHVPEDSVPGLRDWMDLTKGANHGQQEHRHADPQ